MSASAERRGRGSAQKALRLMLVDRDPWCRAIADGALRARGYRVVCIGDVETAARVARELLPDLVVFDVSLPLIEDVPSSQRRGGDRAGSEPFPRVEPAYAILRALELEPSGAAHDVVMLKDELAGKGNGSSRFAVLGYVEKPFTPYTLVQQLETHVGRLRFRAQVVGARASLEAAKAVEASKEAEPTQKAEPTQPQPALEGSIDQIGIPAILESLHFNQLSGTCTLRTAEGRSAEVHFREGEIVAARTQDGLLGVDAVYRVMSWSVGHFSFVIQTPKEDGPIRYRFEHILLEGIKRLDEQSLFPIQTLMSYSLPVSES